MPIIVHCPCGAQFRVRDEYAGKKAQCPTCGEAVVIPTEADQTPSYVAAPGASGNEPEGEIPHPLRPQSLLFPPPAGGRAINGLPASIRGCSGWGGSAGWRVCWSG